MLKRVIALVDGENLVARYQAMLEAGAQPAAEGLLHRKDIFVWQSYVSRWTEMDLRRVSYFTSFVGSDEDGESIEDQIGQMTHMSHGLGYRGVATLIPRVYRRRRDSRKTRVVDIAITIDFMNALADPQVDAIFLISGDGDFLHLIREARRTSKQVHIGALSSGLEPALRRAADQFVDLDLFFFRR